MIRHFKTSDVYYDILPEILTAPPGVCFVTTTRNAWQAEEIEDDVVEFLNKYNIEYTNVKCVSQVRNAKSFNDDDYINVCRIDGITDDQALLMKLAM